jgi:hypothetical protein
MAIAISRQELYPQHPQSILRFSSVSFLRLRNILSSSLALGILCYTLIGIDINDISPTLFSGNIGSHTAAGFYTFVTADAILIGLNKTHTSPPVFVCVIPVSARNKCLI